MSDDLHSLSGAYVVDALDEQERNDFEAHLERCATCQDEVASFREVTPLLAETVAIEPPPSLRQDVLARVRTTRQEPPHVETDSGADVHPLRPPERKRWIALAAAAAVLIGGGVTWQTVEWATTSPTEEVVSAQDARTWETTTADGGQVVITCSEDEGAAVMRVEGLSDPGEGRAYQAWLVDAEGNMASAGMVPGTDGEMLLEGDVEAAAGVGVSEEPADGSRQPTTDPVALVELG